MGIQNADSFEYVCPSSWDTNTNGQEWSWFLGLNYPFWWVQMVTNPLNSRSLNCWNRWPDKKSINPEMTAGAVQKSRKGEVGGWWWMNVSHFTVCVSTCSPQTHRQNVSVCVYSAGCVLQTVHACSYRIYVHMYIYTHNIYIHILSRTLCTYILFRMGGFVQFIACTCKLGLQITQLMFVFDKKDHLLKTASVRLVYTCLSFSILIHCQV